MRTARRLHTHTLSLSLFFLSLQFLMLSGAVAGAQQPAPLGGLAPFALAVRGRSVRVSAASGNVSLSIPIFAKPGRGVPFAVNLTYNSNVFVNVGAAFGRNYAYGSGWTVGPALGSISNTTTQIYTRGNPRSGTCQYAVMSGFYYVDPSGTSHPFSGSLTRDISCGLPPSSLTATASDGSGYELHAASAGTDYVVNRSGSILYPNGGGAFAIEDTNGNYISSARNGSETDWTDTTGSIAAKMIPESGCTNPVDGLSYPNCTAIEVPEPGSSSYATYLLVYNNVAASTEAGCTGIADYSGTVSVPVFLVLPEYTSGSHWYYQFGYDFAGRLNSITFPAGGVTTLSYGNLCAFGNGTPASVAVTESDGGTQGTTTYTRSSGSTSIAYPDGAKTVETYDADGLPTDIQNYDTDGVTLLREVVRTYTSGPPELPATAVIYQNGVRVSERDTSFDTYGNLTSETDIDWARDGTGATKRVTTIHYLYQGNSNYVAPNIVDRPDQITVQDGASNIYAETAITYDNYAAPSGLSASSGALNHGSSFGTGYTLRGNPTEISRDVSSGNPLNTYLAYDDTGNVITVKAPDGNQVATNYGNCADAYPSSTTVPGGSEILVYDCGTGRRTQQTDPAGAQTRFSYDAEARPSGTVNADGGGDAISYVSPTEVSTATKISASLTATDYRMLGGYGELAYGQRAVPTGGCDTVEYVWDNMGRTTKTSTPYNTACAAPGAGAAFTVAVFDGLNRLKSVTQPDGSSTTNYSYTASATRIAAPGGTPTRILERDGWGDLWQVCEVSAQSGSSACGLAIGGNGFLTQYTYNPLGLLTGVSQHGESRSFAYDWLGRMTGETTPEAGTTAFTFDSSGTCGTVAGSLVEREDNAGNVTCYAHDGWGRVTGITYPSGPNAAATPAKTFVYDSANVDGAGMTYAAGRLAEAYTGPAGAKITDEGFGYDAMGRPSEFYESTPHSGGYYVSDASWWLDGRLRTMSEPLIPAITYDPDSAGRIVSVSAASGQNPVSNVSYFAGNLVNTVTYGSGDYDSYTYNNDLRMTQYTLDINGSNDIGKLTWNGNGTLASLGITDPFASGDTQNCSYTQDDLGRLTSANCGGEWAQTYTPDPFGNQSTKSGGSSPLVASFNGKNQFASVSGFVPNYDLDGDLLDNPLGQVRNAYAWDADGHLVNVEGVAQVLDALGRVVEDQQNEVLWTPWGEEFGHMNGQSAGAGDEVRLPGGGAVVYAGSSLSVYLHMDWERNWRLGSTPSRGFSWDEAYGPYGTGYAGNGWPGYTDKWNDDPDGLLEFPARYESPGLKRWLSPDPASLAAVNPADPESWNQYAYANNTPLSLIDPLGLAVCRPTVKLHLPNDNKSDEASGEFGPYQPQGDSAAGEQAADPPGYSGCAEPDNPWDTFSIDGADVGGLGMSMDLGFGGPDGTGAGIGGFSDCPTFACSPTVTGHDGLVHALNYGYTPLYGASTSIQFSWGTDMSATVFGTLGWSVGPPQSSFSFLPLLAPASSAGPGGGLLGSNGAAIANLGRGLATVTHPFEFLLADEFIGATGVLTVGGGAAVIGFGCGAPGVDLLTCIPALGAGVPIITLGVGEAGLAGYLFWSKTLPAFRSWGQE